MPNEPTAEDYSYGPVLETILLIFWPLKILGGLFCAVLVLSNPICLVAAIEYGWQWLVHGKDPETYGKEKKAKKHQAFRAESIRLKKAS